MILPLLGLLAATGGAAALGQGFVLPWIKERERRKENDIRGGLLQNVDPNDPNAQAGALMKGGLLDEGDWFTQMAARDRTMLGEQGAMERTMLGEQGANNRAALGEQGANYRFEQGNLVDWSRLALEAGYDPTSGSGPLTTGGYTALPPTLPDDIAKTVEVQDAQLDLLDDFSTNLEAYDATSPLTFPGTTSHQEKVTLQDTLVRQAGEIIQQEAVRRNGGNEPSQDLVDRTRADLGFPDDFKMMMPGELPTIKRALESYRTGLLRTRESTVGRGSTTGPDPAETGGTVSGSELTTEKPAAVAEPIAKQSMATGDPQGSATSGAATAPSSYNYPAFQMPEQGRQSSLLSSESGGNWRASNSEGMVGRVQFSPARLAEARSALGVNFTTAEFRDSPRLQQAAEKWHFNDIGAFIEHNGLDKAVGRRVRGVPITLKGMVFAAHLGGKGGMKKFIESGGKYDPADSNGTHLSDYLAMGARDTYG